MTNQFPAQRMPMPGRLKGVLAILGFQILANGFVGFLALDVADSASNEGLAYFLALLSFAIAATLLVCAVLTPTRRSWIRLTVITVEALGVVGGLINLFSGQPAAFIGIALAVAVIAMLNRDDVRDYFATDVDRRVIRPMP